VRNVDAYTQMLRIRMVEEAIARDFRARKIFSFLHLSIGQEAVAVGVCAALQKEDRVWGNHRSHGHYLAKGGDMFRMLAEIYGKAGGCCKGNGGSMHMLDRAAGFMGSTPILGSIVPIALGSAFEQKVRDSSNISVVFFGDGASEEGVVYESINMAAVKGLPIVFVIENNLYSVNTPALDRRHAWFNWEKVVTGLGADFISVTGNDVQEVYEAATKARRFAVAGAPVVVEAITYREMAHSGPIKDESCRGIDTEEARQLCDPLKLLRERMTMEELQTVSHITHMVQKDVDQLMELVRHSPEPVDTQMWQGVYA
jgi:TPP-dependent pyruvate/acetoin dehydrogenase alpha subunit